MLVCHAVGILRLHEMCPERFGVRAAHHAVRIALGKHAFAHHHGVRLAHNLEARVTHHRVHVTLLEHLLLTTFECALLTTEYVVLS